MASGSKPVARHIASLAATLAFLLAASIIAAAGRPGDQSRTPTVPRPIGADEGVVQGQVVDARSGRPIPGATVELSGSSGVISTTSDAEGNFESGALEPGDYRIRAQAPGYVPAQYGQRQPQEQEAVLNVRAGQPTSGINMRLHPAGTVSGRIFDDRGEGLAGVEVELVTERYTPDGPAPLPVAFAQTEQAGAFRFANVLPGDYFVRAYITGTRRPSRGIESQVYRATFLPGVPDIETAQALRIAAGQELFGVDFELLATPTRRVSGTVTEATGLPGAALQVRLNGIGGTRSQYNSVTDADGGFEIREVTPGNYMIGVADPTPGADNSRWISTAQEVTVEDAVTDLELRARVGARLEGRVIPAPDAVQLLNPSSVNVDLWIPLGSKGWLGTRSGFVIGADGAFSLFSPGGESSIRVSGLPFGWTLKVIRLDGRDITDELIDFGDGIRRGIEIVLTDRVSGAVGVVVNENGRPAAQSSIIVFPDDRTRWTTPSRFVRETRSDRDGRFEFAGLPPASYLAVALERVPANAWTDPDVLDRLRSSASRFQLEEGEQQAISIRLSRTANLFPMY